MLSKNIKIKAYICEDGYVAPTEKDALRHIACVNLREACNLRADRLSQDVPMYNIPDNNEYKLDYYVISDWLIDNKQVVLDFLNAY